MNATAKQQTTTAATGIELRNVKHAAFASEETACYEATIYVDGKPFCKVSNDGHGGADHYTPAAKGQTYAQLQDALLDLARRINPQATREPIKAEFTARGPDEIPDDWYAHGPMSPESVLEGYCGHLLDRYLTGKRLQRDLRGKLIVLTKAGKLWTYKPKAGAPAEAFRGSIRNKQERDGDPVVKVLNDLPLDEALDILLAHAEVRS